MGKQGKSEVSTGTNHIGSRCVKDVPLSSRWNASFSSEKEETEKNEEQNHTEGEHCCNCGARFGAYGTHRERAG
jgi:hypothetical protein